MNEKRKEKRKRNKSGATRIMTTIPTATKMQVAIILQQQSTKDFKIDKFRTINNNFNNRNHNISKQYNSIINNKMQYHPQECMSMRV